MTKTDIIRRVRILILDTNTGMPRWTDQELYDAMDDAITVIRSERPDSRYDANGALFDERYGTGTESDVILLPNSFTEAMVYYMAHKCYLKDDADSVNDGKATQFYQLYQTAVQR